MSMQPGYGPPPPEQPLARIGDIVVSQNWVSTPVGAAPLAGSQWFTREQAFPVRRIPSWAIVAAILTAIFFLIGLLFLLVRETRWEGYVEVTVQADTLTYTTLVRRDTPEGMQTLGLLAYVRQLAAQASPSTTWQG